MPINTPAANETRDRRERTRQRLHDLPSDRQATVDAIAKIQGGHVPDVQEVLYPYRPVQAEAFLNDLDLRRVALLVPTIVVIGSPGRRRMKMKVTVRVAQMAKIENMNLRIRYRCIRSGVTCETVSV